MMEDLSYIVINNNFYPALKVRVTHPRVIQYIFFQIKASIKRKYMIDLPSFFVYISTLNPKASINNKYYYMDYYSLVFYHYRFAYV